MVRRTYIKHSENKLILAFGPVFMMTIDNILDILHLIANQNFLLIVAEFTLRSGSHSGFKKKPLTKVQEQDAFLSHTYSRSRSLRSNLNLIRNISLDFKDLRIFLDLHEIVLLPIGFNPGHFL